MNMKKFECVYSKECSTKEMNPEKCMICMNNRKRNYMEDHFIDSKDDPIPEKHVYAKPYNGPAEQTEGYECPICHGHTNPYAIKSDKCCQWCGYKILL